MSEFNVTYDEDTGELNISSDLDLELKVAPLLRDVTGLVRDLNKTGVSFLQSMVDLQEELLKTRSE